MGIDVSKSSLSVCFYQLMENHKPVIKGSRTFKNTPNGFKALRDWIKQKQVSDLPVLITIEATGIYYESVTYFLNKEGFLVSVVLPNKSKAFMQSYNIKTKTDQVDAKALGLMGIERDLPNWAPISPHLRQLKQLTRERVHIIEEKVALGNKLHALQYAFESELTTIQRLKQRLNLCNSQIDQLDSQIEQLLEKAPLLNDRVMKICKVKGLGLTTVATVIAETNAFELFTSQSQLVSYAGYDVVQVQSGSSINGKTRISKKGNRYIRRALHFPALTVIKYEPNFQRVYNRILEKSNVKMIGVVAVQRKLLILIYTLFNKNVSYDPNYQAKQSIGQKTGRQDTSPAYTG